MSKTKSLKGRVSDISIYSFICMSVVMFVCFWAYSVKKNHIAIAQIKSELSLNLKNQTSQFLRSYLLPEQRAGMDLILAGIRNDESLDEIKILESVSDIPNNFTDCKLNETAVTTCSTKNFAITSVIAPLHDSEKTYAYLFKARKNSSAKSVSDAMQFAGAAVFIIALAFFVIYLRLRNLTAKQLPDSMDQLTKWIEAEIEGKEIENITLGFSELEDLKKKISTVIERANKSREQAIIGQVTSGIMHDIKTPLHSIVTATHLVDEQRADSEDRPMLLENLFNMCRNNIPLIREIIETTLDGNRNIQINKSTANLRDTIDKAIAVTKEFSRFRNVSVEVDAPAELFVDYDSTQFARVVNNLLKNGIEAAAETSTTPKVKISATQNEKNINLIVEDSGIGFKGSPDKAFRAFRTTKVRGTGLGLLISKKIVEAHNGKIKASNGSTYGGARMEVELPLGG
ncbi:MAG: HAMP domain-containing histidine kinase [Bdellovibrionales bacterium]|nr:HAMP domain-containing histidine kinase [Bdellovibrionales bacterium]